MKTKFKSAIRAACQSFGRAVCAGAVMLIDSSAPAQNLFVSDFGTKSIYEVTPGGVKSTFASGLINPAGLAFDSAGNLFVSDQSSGNVYEFTPGGVRTTFASLSDSSPIGLAFDSAGDLFVSGGGRPGTANIYEFTPGGTQSIFASGLDEPIGLAFDSAGDLFEADRGTGSINEFTPGGTRSTFASGLSAPYGLAFQGVTLPVPEPSPLGLLAVGATALLVRRRRCQH